MLSFFKDSFFLKKTLSSILILSILVPSIFFTLPPKKADALFGLGDITFDPANFVKNSISAIFEGTTAAATVAGTGGTLAHNVKVFILDGLATAMARLMIQKITAQTVNWINSGFKGSPAFVTNPDTLALNTADQIFSRNFIKGGKLENLCGPFKAQIRIALVKTYLAEDDAQLNCTISTIASNVTKIGNDFNRSGGWDSFLKVTQESQNNPWGAYNIANSKISADIGLGKANLEKDQAFGKGFMSFKKCPKGYSNADLAKVETGISTVVFDENGNIEGVGADQQQGIKNALQDPKGCSVNEETVTPGSVIEGQLSKVLGSSVSQLELTNSINQIVNALMLQLVNRLFSGISDGLRGLGDKQPTERVSLASQLQTDSPETKTEVQKALVDSNKNIPSTLGVKINPETGETMETTPTNLVPQINEADVKARAKEEIKEYQGEYTNCGTNGTTCGTNPDSTPPPPSQ